MLGSINDSQFYMWRTLFAMSHADDIVTEEEMRFMTSALEDVPFSGPQKLILQKDIGVAQDIVEMFRNISDPKDQARFFRFARELVWIDGDYGEEEQEILLKLKEEHVKHVDVSALVGEVDLEFEGDDDPVIDADEKAVKTNFKSRLEAFRKYFFETA